MPWQPIMELLSAYFIAAFGRALDLDRERLRRHRTALATVSSIDLRAFRNVDEAGAWLSSGAAPGGA